MFRKFDKVFPKYIGFLTIMSVIPLLIIGILSYRFASQTILESEKQFSTDLLNAHVELLNTKLSQIESLIENISSVESITSVLDDEFTQTNAYLELTTKANIGYILNGYINLDGLISIDIFTLAGAHYHVGETLNVDNTRDEIKTQIWEETIASPNQIYWAGVRPNVNQSSRHAMVLNAAKSINKFNRETLTTEHIGLILISLNVDSLAVQKNLQTSSNNAGIFLVDHRDNIIHSYDPAEIGLPASNIFPVRLQQKSNLTAVNISGDDYFIQSTNIADYQWRIFRLIPEKQIHQKINRIGRITAFLVTLGLLISSFAGWYFSRNIVQPIKDIANAYKKLQDKPFEHTEHLPVRSSDEVGDLIKGFNNFLDSLEARQLYEQALRASEERYALVAQATNEGLWDLDLKTNKVFFSPRFLSLVGYDDKPHLQNSLEDWWSIIHPDELELVRSGIEAHIHGETSHFQSEHRVLHTNGSYLWVLSRGKAIHDEDGKAIRMAGSLTDISYQKKAALQLSHDAFHDNLTDLYNRAWITSYLQAQINNSSRRTNSNFAILFLDLDQFKIVNDSLGHAAGDVLLIEVSKRLKKTLRENDILARFGGDEFIVYLESDEDYRFIQVAERIIEQLSHPFSINSTEIYSGVSIGITLKASGYKNANDMLRDADIAMYQAKKNGKNCYVVFDKNMREQLLSKIETEKLLRDAIKNNELELHYQPVISLKEEKLIGFEALIRWSNPTLGNVSPDEFIPLAEANGTMIELGQWVFEAAFMQLNAWKKEFPHLNGITVSINMSPVQFFDESYLNSLPELMAKYDIKSSDIAIEITETAIIRNTELARKVINNFKKWGIQVHLDDFGTGYSSLSHLAGLQIDLIKIDRSFVQRFVKDSKKDKLVKAIINFAHELNIVCTAEGIEEQAQQTQLTSYNCDHAQGYFIARPAPAKDLTKFILEHLPSQS